VTRIEDWWAQGETGTVTLGEVERTVFWRRMGSGPVLSALHGFPSSSHDWDKVAPALASSHTLLMPDLLGFGASEKPSDHSYAILEQADLVEAMWLREGVTETAIVAHDYSVSVTQELLARRADGELAVEITRVVLLNGGVYPELHRPEPGQTVLLDPEQGPKLSALLNQELFTAAIAPTFAPGFDASADSEQIWRSVNRADGQLISHLLIAYIPERRRHRDRWVHALERADVPLSFVWGMRDPVSGAHMAARIAERLPHAPLTALQDVGHWPQLEAPGRVQEAVLGS